MNHFVTIFKIAPGPSVMLMDIYYRLGVGIIVLAVGVILGIYYVKRRIANKGKTKLFKIKILSLWALGWLGFAAICVLYANPEYLSLSSAYQKGDYLTVEGQVHVLRKQPWSGHAPGDLVVIGDTEFNIDYFVFTQAYHQTIAHGGQLRDGVYAKVFYMGNDILRIDIKRNGHHSIGVPHASRHPLTEKLDGMNNVPSPYLLNIGVLLIILANIIWYRAKLILKQKGCQVDWFWNHFNDYPKLLKAIEAETDKVELRKLIIQKKLMLSIWVIFPVGAILIIISTL